MADETDLRDLSEEEIAQLRTLLERRSRGEFVDLDQAKTDTLEMLERKRKARDL